MNDIVFEEIKVKLPELRVWFDDREIYLSLSQLRLLMILLTDPQGVFTNDELVAMTDMMSRESLHQVVPKLRRALGGKYIVSVRGTGYSLTKERN